MVLKEAVHKVWTMKQRGSTESRTVLETTDLDKDLGINVDPSLKFSRYVEMQVNKANKILGLLLPVYKCSLSSKLIHSIMWVLGAGCM